MFCPSENPFKLNQTQAQQILQHANVTTAMNICVKTFRGTPRRQRSKLTMQQPCSKAQLVISESLVQYKMSLKGMASLRIDHPCARSRETESGTGPGFPERQQNYDQRFTPRGRAIAARRKL